MPAFIYASIPLYRLAMNILYAGAYIRRAQKVSELLKGKTITELCFGDTILASECRRKNMKWKGYDVNKRFVDRANKKGFDAVCADVSVTEITDVSDECVMMGSLYHFGSDPGAVILKMLEISDRVIISEPVKNLSNPDKVTGRIFARLTSAGKGPESFRFTETGLISLLGELKKKHNFTFEIAGHFRKDLVLIIQRAT